MTTPKKNGLNKYRTAIYIAITTAACLLLVGGYIFQIDAMGDDIETHDLDIKANTTSIQSMQTDVEVTRTNVEWIKERLSD